MFSRCKILVAGALLAATAWGAAAEGSGVLRVAADPNNLPFSNNKGEGFENKIAELLAGELNEKVEYTWHAERRGFFRETLKSGPCEIALGAPSHCEMAATTQPYYRSSYVFVTRKDRHLGVHSLDDPRFGHWKIGAQIAGDSTGNPPPLQALAARGWITNVVAFNMYGDYREANPPARIINAVADGTVDVAIAWGPLAGYFAAQTPVPLEIAPVSPATDHGLPMTYAISVAVKRGNKELLREIEEILTRRQGDIEKILDEYHVPQLPLHSSGAK